MNKGVLVLLVLAACKRGDGAYGALRDAKVTFLSDGAGPENEAPLEPVIAGYRAAMDDTWQRWTGGLDAGVERASSARVGRTLTRVPRASSPPTARWVLARQP